MNTKIRFVLFFISTERSTSDDNLSKRDFFSLHDAFTTVPELARSSTASPSNPDPATTPTASTVRRRCLSSRAIIHTTGAPFRCAVNSDECQFSDLKSREITQKPTSYLIRRLQHFNQRIQPRHRQLRMNIP